MHPVHYMPVPGIRDYDSQISQIIYIITMLTRSLMNSATVHMIENI